MREAHSGFDLFLGSGLEHAVRLVVVHGWTRRLRLALLWEAPWVALAHLCLLPLRAWLWLTSFGLTPQLPRALPAPNLRLFDYGYTIGLRVFGQDDRLLDARDASPSDAVAAGRYLGSVLRAAHERSLVVLEVLGHAPERVHQAFFGGQPLMAAPTVRDEEASCSVLRSAGWRVEAGPDAVTFVEPERLVPRVVAWLRVLLLAPVAPLLALGSGGRTLLREALRDARGVPPRERSLVVRAESLEFSVARAGVVVERQLLNAHNWLSLSFAPAPTFDEPLVAQKPRLRMGCRDRCITPFLVRAPALGPALADVLVAVTRRLRAQRPELELAHAFVPSHCHRCGSMVSMQPGSVCPTCATAPPA